MKAPALIAAALSGFVLVHTGATADQPVSPPVLKHMNDPDYAFPIVDKRREALKTGDLSATAGTGTSAEGDWRGVRRSTPLFSDDPAGLTSVEQRKAFFVGLLLSAVVFADQNTLSGRWFERVFGRTIEPRQTDGATPLRP